MQTIVLSLGGSVILSEDINDGFLRKISSLLTKLSHYYKIFIVAGGGNVARRYIKLGRELGLDEKKLDEIGIAITRVNAKLLATIIDRADKRIPNTTDEAKRINESIVIMGGTTPGHSTDMVATEIAAAGTTMASGESNTIRVWITNGYAYLSSGTTVDIKIHSAGGMDYIKLIPLV